MEQLFKKHFYNPDNILNSVDLWKVIKRDNDYNVNYTRKLYDDWLKKQEDQQIETVVNRKIKAFHPIIAADDTFQIDLMFLDKYSTINKGYSCIINYVEITSKLAYAYALKDKQATTIYDSFLTFKKAHGHIRAIEIDKGSEFNKVIKYCDEHDIHVLVYNNNKNSMSIVERFNKSLRGYIKKVCKDNVWFKKLDIILAAYNNKIHSATNMTPNEMTKNDEARELYRNNLIWDSIPAKIELDKFKVGDKVRAYIKKKQFDKGTGEFTKTVHTITAIQGNSIILDDNDNIKYRYYNLKHIGEVEANPNKIDKTESDKAVKAWKLARRLHKEIGNNYSKVKDTDAMLQNNINKPKGQRIRKPTAIYDV